MRAERIRSEPYSTFISTLGVCSITLAGKPMVRSFTSNATPASVDAKAWDDARLRIDDSKMVQDRLVGNFSRQADVFRCNQMCIGRHERLPPMRRRAGNMSDSVGTDASQEICSGFVRAREEQ